MADLKIQQLPTAGTIADDTVLPVVTTPGTTPTDGSASIATIRKAMVKTVTVAFTNGDSYRRVTITDAAVLATSNIIGTIRRPDTASDSVDLGWQYEANVVLVANGSFDITVSCSAWGFDDPAASGLLNETVTYCYLIG